MKIQIPSDRTIQCVFGSAIAILFVAGAFSYRSIIVSDQSYRWIEHTVVAATLLGLMIIAAAGWGVLHDHSRYQLAEQALRESERKYRLLLEGIKDYAILMLGPLGEIRSSNSGAERMSGCAVAGIR
jgi:PAS domain-containing protein